MIILKVFKTKGWGGRATNSYLFSQDKIWTIFFLYKHSLAGENETYERWAEL